MKVKYIFLLAILFSTAAMPQGFLNMFTWDVGIPVSKTSEFTDKTSYLGFEISERKYLDPSNSIGLSIAWNNFDERMQEPIYINQERISGTISGTQLRAINSFPILVGYHHYFGKYNETRTVIGLNTGVYYITQRLDIGVYQLETDNWHFGISPELGFMIPIEDMGADLYVTGKYHYAFDSGTSVGGRENNFYSYWNINIGFAISAFF